MSVRLPLARVAAVLSLILTGCRPSTELTIVTFGGGVWHESQKREYIEPFSKELNIKVNSLVWGAEFAKLESAIQMNQCPWDVVEVTDAQYERGVKLGLYAPLTVSLNPADFREGDIGKFGVANVYWATAFVYKKGDSEAPASWADFWDVEKYPGARALNDDPRSNLEFALLAEGITPDRLYPLDLDRAFRALDRLKPHIKVWWSDGMQPMQLVDTGQVRMSSLWTGRLYSARRDFPSLELCWGGAAHVRDFWVIPRTSKNAQMANAFIHYATDADRMARQVISVGYGPSNLGSLQSSILKQGESEVVKWLPTTPENFDRGFVLNVGWWAENEKVVSERWRKWRQ